MVFLVVARLFPPHFVSEEVFSQLCEYDEPVAGPRGQERRRQAGFRGQRFGEQNWICCSLPFQGNFSAWILAFIGCFRSQKKGLRGCKRILVGCDPAIVWLLHPDSCCWTPVFFGSRMLAPLFQYLSTLPPLSTLALSICFRLKKMAFLRKCSANQELGAMQVIRDQAAFAKNHGLFRAASGVDVMCNFLSSTWLWQETCKYTVYIYMYTYIRHMPALCPDPQWRQATHHHHHHHHHHQNLTPIEDLQWM